MAVPGREARLPHLEVAQQLETAPPPLRPLTEWILAWLPGPRYLWVAAVVALQLLAAVLPTSLNPIAGRGLRLGGLPPQVLAAAVYAYAVVLAFWGIRRMAAEATDVEGRLVTMRKATGPASDLARPTFREVGWHVPPLVLALFVSSIALVTGVVTVGPLGLLIWPVSFLTNLPLLTALWTYLAVLIGLDRLGRQKLDLDDAFPTDPLLGLRPVGSLAFTVFLVMAAEFVPVILVSFVNAAFLILDLALFLPGVVLFFFALYRLHRQMAATKRRHVRRAREFYRQVYDPLWRSGGLEDWRRESNLLEAADKIERRALSISTWPFSPGVMGWILGLSTGLLITMLGRLLLTALRF